ncbi:MAG: 30S ribosomal protein S13 [Candidatus Micrarchaeota archaeon]|nr:30S ribosomal protein S13 [Candidatus Micrarchaeota archaeon]
MAEKGNPKHEEKRGPAKRPSQGVPAKPMISESGKEVRGVVRLAGKDLRGNLPIMRAITSIRGIGINMGQVISQVAYSQLGVNEKTMLGELSEPQIEKLEQILFHPENFGVPSRLFNRRKDLLSGKDIHAIGSDLAYFVKQDIDHEKDSGTWRGFRHAYGQKVRGQRTRSTGRTGMTVGVLRKSVLAKTGAAAQQTGAAAQQQAASAKAAQKAEAPKPKAPKPEEAKK